MAVETKLFVFKHHSPVSVIWAVAIAGLLVVALGCGRGNPITPSSSPVQVKIADAPAERVVSFELTVNSVTLTKSDNSTVTVLNTPTRVELTHLSASPEPLRLVSVPQGTYTKATINVAQPEVKFVNDLGQLVEAAATLTSSTAIVNFSPAVTIGSGATSLNFDLDLAASVAINPVNSTASVTPTFTASSASIPAESEQEAENGEMDDITGTVTSVSGNSFTISVEQSPDAMTFATDANTQFEAPLTGLSSLSNNMIVEVDGVTKPDGSLLAKKVEAEVEVQAGEELEGLVTSVTGAPATQFKIVLQDEAGPGTLPPLGTEITVAVDNNTNFKVDSDKVDLSNLPFPSAFDANTLAKAQKVEADTEQPGVTPIPAKKVKLKRQALNGTVSGYAQNGQQATFMLNFANDSAFFLLTGKTSAKVLQQPGTELKGITTPIADNTAVRVRGVLFFDPTGLGAYNLVASRISIP